MYSVSLRYMVVGDGLVGNGTNTWLKCENILRIVVPGVTCLLLNSRMVILLRASA